MGWKSSGILAMLVLFTGMEWNARPPCSPGSTW